MNEGHLHINQEGLQRLGAFTDEMPVFMINYLNYKDKVTSTGKTGKETYKEYMQAAIPFFKQVDAEIIFKGVPMEMIIGPDDEALWDEILIIKYANKKEFFKLMKFKEYPSALRASALSDSRILFCK